MRYQVYLRVLPVLFLAVFALGAFSWTVFTRWTLNSALEYQQKDLSTFVVQLQNRAAVAAMSAETHRSSLVFHDHSGNWSGHGDKLLQVPLVRGVLSIGPAGSQKARETNSHLANFLSLEKNHRQIDKWWQARSFFTVEKYEEETWAKASAISSSLMLNGDLSHKTRIFSPILLDQITAENVSLQTTVLPVLVWDDCKGRGDLLSSSKSRAHGAVYFLDLAGLTDKIPTSSWFTILNDVGQVLVSSSAGLPAGSFIQDHAGGSANSLLSVANGNELASLLDLPNGKDHGIFGSLFSPWLVISKSVDNMPVSLLSARPIGYLQNMTFRYFAMVLGIAVLALAGAVVGVTRVMEPLSSRLSYLAQNMEDVAKGNYSQRMPESNNDEVDQLVGYFNLMAVSLDEAHRQVKDKAVHLRAALENMRMLDRAKDDFLVLISHEVRTPLTAIKGGVNFLKSSVAKVESEDRKILDKLNVSEIADIIEKSSNRLSGFMTDAIQMTAIQSSNQTLDLKPVPVMDLVEIGLVGVRDHAQQKGVTIENNLDESVRWSVLCDLSVLKVAFERLMDNAISHNETDGVIRISEVSSVPEQGEVSDLTDIERIRALMGQSSMQEWEDEELRWRLIEIYNSGEPIPEDRLGALFGKFEIVGRIEHHHKGSGLSLPIAQAAVAHHGGGIFVHSNGQTGNSFYVLLPTMQGHSSSQTGAQSDAWDDARQSVVRTAGNENVGKVTDPTSLKVELKDPGSGGLSQGDKSGSGINGTGCTDNNKNITVGSS